MYVVGDLIHLKGITGHGRRRLRKHGRAWRVMSWEQMGIEGDAPDGGTPIISLKTGAWKLLRYPDRDVIVR
jgi:hypothetical protein